ncbi:MAG: hypothetical protein ACREMY_04120, partial [bacterium]
GRLLFANARATDLLWFRHFYSPGGIYTQVKAGGQAMVAPSLPIKPPYTAGVNLRRSALDRLCASDFSAGDMAAASSSASFAASRTA